jgi:STE24 endopeptidase
VETATRAYLAQLPANKKASSDKYFEGGYRLYLFGILYTAAVMFLLLSSGASVRIRDLATRITSRRNLQTAIYFALLVVIVAVLQFPLDFYRDFVREHRYGLSAQTFGAWLWDLLVGWTAMIILGAVPVVAVFAVVRRAGRSWWIWASGTAVFFIAIGLTIAPVFIEPLFNKYTPLENGAVRDAILSMARANGVPVNNVYVVDESRQTTRISANVSGFLGTSRIALNDNLLKRCSLAEIEAVMGHEIGHYVLGHNREQLLFFAIVAFVFFAWLNWSMRAALRRWGARWRVSEASDLAVAPLAVLMFCAFLLVMTPVGNSFLRAEEYAADIFGLNAAGQPDGFAQIALKFANYRKLEPNKWEEAIFYDHPSGRARIYSAMRWKAEHLAEFHSEKPSVTK